MVRSGFMGALKHNNLVKQLVLQAEKAGPDQAAQIVAGVGQAAFVPDLLEVDEPLWGGFWHFDVLSPGYLLPAGELALLRATRLDGTWPPETSLDHFLADLHRAIQHPQAGLWTLALAGEACLVCAAELQPQVVTVAWYCASTGYLHAGYRLPPSQFWVGQALEQRPPQFGDRCPGELAQLEEVAWLRQAVEQSRPLDLASRLDLEILRRRLGE